MRERERFREKVDQEILTGNERSAKEEEEEEEFRISLLQGEIYDVSLAARDNKTPLESARFGFKSNNNNNNNNSLIVSSIALPHPKVARYSSHQRAGRTERERERLYLRLREKTALC